MHPERQPHHALYGENAARCEQGGGDRCRLNTLADPKPQQISEKALIGKSEQKRTSESEEFPDARKNPRAVGRDLAKTYAWVEHDMILGKPCLRKTVHLGFEKRKHMIDDVAVARTLRCKGGASPFDAVGEYIAGPVLSKHIDKTGIPGTRCDVVYDVSACFQRHRGYACAPCVHRKQIGKLL